MQHITQVPVKCQLFPGAEQILTAKTGLTNLTRIETLIDEGRSLVYLHLGCHLWLTVKSDFGLVPIRGDLRCFELWILF